MNEGIVDLLLASRCGSHAEGWYYRPEPPTCYYMSSESEKETLNGAIAACATRGAQLSSTTSPEEMDFLTDNIYRYMTSDYRNLLVQFIWDLLVILNLNAKYELMHCKRIQSI